MLKVSSIQMQTIPQDREWFRTRLFIFHDLKKERILESFKTFVRLSNKTMKKSQNKTTITLLQNPD